MINFSDCADVDFGQDYAPDDVCEPADEWNPPRLCSKHKFIHGLKGAKSEAILDSWTWIVSQEKAAQRASEHMDSELASSQAHRLTILDLTSRLEKVWSVINSAPLSREECPCQRCANLNDWLDDVEELKGIVDAALNPEPDEDN